MKPYLVPNSFDLSALQDADGKYLFTSNNLQIFVQAINPEVPTDNSIGVLSEAIQCLTTHGPKGYDELQMTYPVDGLLYSKIQQRNLIVARTERNRGNQPYRIYRITKPINGKIGIYAKHICYDLRGIVVKPFKATNIQQALSRLKSNAMTYCPFTFTTTRDTVADFEVKVPTTIWDLLGGNEGSLLDVYGGEYLFDGYTVHLENSIGSDNGVNVIYGVNMTDFEQDSSIDDCYTGVVMYWANEDDIIYSDPISVSGTYGYAKILPVDISSDFSEKPSYAMLREAADAYIQINKIGKPKVNWTINFVPLDMTEEYKNVVRAQQVNVGDTVGVKFEKLGVDVKSKVVEIEWDVLKERYNSVSLGDVKNNVADTICSQTAAIQDKTSAKDVSKITKSISEALTKAILGASGGAVRLLDTDRDGQVDTLYIADNRDPSIARKVWRFNYEGWAASDQGYNGPFKMGATLEDGLLADFVTAAHLTAGTIESADGTTFVLDLDAGTLQIGGYATTSQVNSANKREHLIYISKSSGTSSVSAPSAWVSDTTGNQNTWTTKRPEYNQAYPVLFVATQREAVGGTVTCTTPRIDETTTVIDGGHIITGSIDANKISVANLQAISSDLAGWLLSNTQISKTVNNQYKVYLNAPTSPTSSSLAIVVSVYENNAWNNKITMSYGGKLTAKNAEITGGTIGGCAINNGVLEVGNANITNINASKITAGTLSVDRLQANSIAAGKLTSGVNASLDNADGYGKAIVENTSEYPSYFTCGNLNNAGRFIKINGQVCQLLTTTINGQTIHYLGYT